MRLTNDDLQKLCEVAMEAAKKAGAHIAATRPEKVEHKDDRECLASSVLTEVDGQCQEMILEILAPTISDFDLGLLAEESEDDGSRLEKDYFWCIDPIDGTLPYIEDTPGYCTSIALVSKEAVPEIGVVYDPVEHTLYHAIRGAGAFRNGEPWTLNEGDGPVHIFTDRSITDLPYFPATRDALEAEVTAVGGGVMNAIWILENPPACYYKFPKASDGGGCFWDYAATACMFHEMGGYVSNFHKTPLSLNDPETLYMNRDGILYATDSALAERVLSLYEELK